MQQDEKRTCCNIFLLKTTMQQMQQTQQVHAHGA